MIEQCGMVLKSGPVRNPFLNLSVTERAEGGPFLTASVFLAQHPGIHTQDAIGVVLNARLVGHKQHCRTVVGTGAQ